MRIEINHSLLSDSPLNESNKSLFTTVVNKSTGDLIEDIINGTPTCYLLSGYRGSGKSSFVKKIQSEIKSLKLDNKKEAVFVYTNFSKYQDYTFQLRKLIRELYLEIKDLDSFAKLKSAERGLPIIKKNILSLEQLYDKTFYDSSLQTLDSQKKEVATTFNIEWTELLKFILPFATTIIFIFNWHFSWFNVNQSFNLLSILLSGGLTILGFFKLSTEISKSKSTQKDFTRKSMYDN